MKTLDPLPYFKWLWRDWRANKKVQKMDYIARGLYRELLDEQWSEGTIPDDLPALADICDCPLEVMETHWPAIEKFFEKTEDGSFLNQKLEKQRTEQDTKRVKLARAGRIGGLAKLNKTLEEEANASEGLAFANECHIAEQSRAIAEHTQSTPECEEIQEPDMKAAKQIPVLCQTILGVKAKLYPEQTAMIQALEAEHKGSAVINAFSEWALEHRGEELRNPVAVFLKEADDLLGGGSPAKAAARNPEVQNLVRELSYLSKGEIQFDDRHKSRLAQHLSDGFSVEEITSAFKEFYANLDKSDAGALKYAAKTFSETADQLAYALGKRKQEAAKLAVLVGSEKFRLEIEAADERARKKAEAEKEVVEETLSWE
jgi:uncharacterized protein YdaU (DUF1376 family)